MEGLQSALWEFDRGFGVPLCGLDEAGRGPLAGPVFAACIILKPGAEIPGLNDSKKLTEQRREAIFEDILGNGKAWFGIGSASPEEIDRINILQATFLAMNRAYTMMLSGEGVPEEFRPRLALVDGNRDPGLPIQTRTVVKGDGKSAAIAAASVLAKVSRDRYMLELDALYPQYQLAKHKGYPTKLHYELLEKHGISPIHRRSFLKNLDKKKQAAGEETAAQRAGKAGVYRPGAELALPVGRGGYHRPKGADRRLCGGESPPPRRYGDPGGGSRPQKAGAAPQDRRSLAPPKG